MAPADPVLGSLLERARKGDPEAFGELVERTRDRLFGAVVAMVKREAVAEEILQETYISLWEEGQSGRVENPAAWLYRSSVNRAIDHLRRSEPSFCEDMGDSLAAIPSETPQPDIVLENAEEARALGVLLGNLPPRERSVLVMSDYLGMDSFEISAALGSSPSTVRSQLANGRKKLADLLKGGEK